jgi:zinc resistance-associated protein
MSKLTIAAFVALCIGGTSPAYAQHPAAMGPGLQLPSEADLKAFNERRIEIVKFALQLTPAQEKYWPAVEEAIRARGEMRRARLARLASFAKDPGERTVIELLRERADSLTQRGASLKKLVDAWQPLYQSLDARQQTRLRLLAMVVLREIRDAAESRMMQADDDYDDFGPGMGFGPR